MGALQNRLMLAAANPDDPATRAFAGALGTRGLALDDFDAYLSQLARLLGRAS